MAWWCGLCCAYAAQQAGWDVPINPLWARNWLKWGRVVPKAGLGDVLVFQRGSAGHVALYVGETATHYHILGGNQNDAVNIKLKARSDCLGIRRCPWRVNEPDNIRPVFMLANGHRSSNENIRLS